MPEEGSAPLAGPPPAEAPAGRPRFASDRPANLADEEDLFGHRDYAAALRDAVLDAETGTTIGLFGPWGVGKSTIIETLRRMLAPHDCAFVQFDSWRYENDAFRREFLRDLASELSDRLTDYEPGRELRDLDVDVAQPEERLTVSLRHGVRSLLGVVLLVAAFVLVAGGIVFSAPPGITVSLIALVPLIGYLATRIESIVQVQTVMVSKKRLEDPDRFARRFSELLGALSAPRLVIAVDNLDRCAPDAAVELLSAIKTYLEPQLRQPVSGPRKRRQASQPHRPPDVVFVIAADADALRRHLCAKAGLPGGSAEAAREAREYADEYLRKFFGVEVTLRPLLGEDMRDYVGRHLRPVVERWVGDEAARDQQARLIVAFAAAGLRRNPRRVKQFANNLELHLGVLREREGAGHLSRPLSDNPALVAKLLLLEEEWPDVFAHLQRDESLLVRLTQAATTPNGTRPPELGLSDDDWALLASVLRNSLGVPGEDQIRGLLRLKLSAAEAALSGYEDFRHLVVLGAYEDVEAFLTATQQPADRYGERLPVVLDEELRAGRVEGALNVIGVTVAVPSLGRWVADVVRPAVDDGLLLKTMAPGSARVLAQAVDRLPPEYAAPVLAALAGSFLAAEDDTALTGLALALAGAAAVLPEATRRTGLEPHFEALRKRLASDGVRDRFGLYEPLVAVEPELISTEVLDAARRSVTHAEGVDELRALFLPATTPGAPPTDEAAAPVVLRHAVRNAALFPEVRADALALDLVPVLTIAAGDDVLFASMVDYLVSLLDAFAEPPGKVDRLAEALVSMHREHPDALILLARLPGEDRGEQVRGLVADWQPEEVLAFVRKRRVVPESVREALLDRADRAEEADTWSTSLIDEVRAQFDRRRLARDVDPETLHSALERWSSAHPTQREELEGTLGHVLGERSRSLGARLEEPVKASGPDPRRYRCRLEFGLGHPPVDLDVVATLTRGEDGRVDIDIAAVGAPPLDSEP